MGGRELMVFTQPPVALGLVLNCITLWNIFYMDKALRQLRADGYPLLDEDVARLSPFGRKYINVIGTYSFTAPTWAPSASANYATPTPTTKMNDRQLQEPAMGRTDCGGDTSPGEIILSVEHGPLASPSRLRRPRGEWRELPGLPRPQGLMRVSGRRGGTRPRPARRSRLPQRIR